LSYDKVFLAYAKFVFRIADKHKNHSPPLVNDADDNYAFFWADYAPHHLHAASRLIYNVDKHALVLNHELEIPYDTYDI
jgi:hypothetical protein